jgi:hypothetical protein
MASVTLNPVLESISGAVGDLVFRRHGDDVVIARRPAGDRQFTPGQVAQQERFRLATVYGRAALADPATKALYEAKAAATGTPVFALAIADFFHAPAVDDIDLSAYSGQVGERIAIRAHDDFELVGVAVAIRKADGTVLEQGAAAAGRSRTPVSSHRRSPLRISLATAADTTALASPMPVAQEPMAVLPP